MISEHSLYVKSIAPLIVAKAKHRVPTLAHGASCLSLRKAKKETTNVSTSFTTVRPHPEKSHASSAPVSIGLLNTLARYFARQAAIARLHELDDDALKDIGKSRSEIEAAAKGLLPPPYRGENISLSNEPQQTVIFLADRSASLQLSQR